MRESNAVFLLALVDEAFIVLRVLFRSRYQLGYADDVLYKYHLRQRPFVMAPTRLTAEIKLIVNRKSKQVVSPKAPCNLRKSLSGFEDSISLILSTTAVSTVLNGW